MGTTSSTSRRSFAEKEPGAGAFVAGGNTLSALRWDPPGTRVKAIWTGRAEGDRRLESCSDPASNLASVPQRAWMRLRQVHGARVVVAGGALGAGDLQGGSCPDEGGAGRGAGDAIPIGDALVAAGVATGLVVATADCAPVALASREGIFAAVHAGWRGLLAGVVEEAVFAMRDLGAGEVVAGIGPCIHVECYGFGDRELSEVVARFGPRVAGRTAGGAVALDLVQTARAAVGAAGATMAYDAGVCTACDKSCFSHRARKELERQVMLVWGEGP